MKLLISAIACDPMGVSEAGIGWNVVSRMAIKHDVSVLTHTRHKEAWESATAQGLVPPNINVRFLGSFSEWHTNRLIARIQSWLDYMQFSRLVLSAAIAWHDQNKFDLVHQPTYATWRIASDLWKMPIPFVWGPLGGTARFPWRFFGILSPSARIFEVVRYFGTLVSRMNPRVRRSISKAAVVIAANRETRLFLETMRGGGSLPQVPSAFITREKKISLSRAPSAPCSAAQPLLLFAGGNIEGRKGVALALHALAAVKAEGIPFHYTIAGGGADVPNLTRLATRLGIASQVSFNPGYRGLEYVAILNESHVYLLPSFRETTPVTLLEAITAGCFPIVADASAAGEIVTLVGGVAVSVKNPLETIRLLAEALIDVYQHLDTLPETMNVMNEKLQLHFSAAAYESGIDLAYHTALNTESQSR